jgi:inner membrane protein
MPFPIAHALLGASIVVAGSPQPIRPNRAWLKKLIIGSILAILPDLDYVGISFLNLNRSWHRGPTHSLLVALVAGALISLLFRRGARLRWAMIYAAAIASHGLLDSLLSMDRGAALLWPLSSHRFAARLWEYPDTLRFLYYSSLDTLVIRGVIHFLKYSAIEFVVMGAVLVLTFLLKSKLNSGVP